MNFTTIGVDLAKSVLQLHGASQVDTRGAGRIVLNIGPTCEPKVHVASRESLPEREWVVSP